MVPETVPATHFLPVFSLDDEAGWLLLVPKADPKLTKLLRSVSRDDDIGPERTVKAWWVSHGTHERVRAALAPAEFCSSCAGGVPCTAWDHEALSYNDFEPRAPDIVSRSQWEKSVADILRGLHEQGPGFLDGFLRGQAAEAFNIKPGSEEAGVLDGLFGSFRAAAAVFGQYRDEMPRGAPWTAPAGPAGMSKARAREILGVAADATPERIKRAFVTASLRWHPDKAGSDPERVKEHEAKMKEVLEARAVLTES